MSPQHAVIDRSSDRAKIQVRLDREARAAGHADHTAAMDADYESWLSASRASR